MTTRRTQKQGAKPPTVQIRTDSIRNLVTKLGTIHGRTSHNVIGRRRVFTMAQLDALQQMPLVQRITGELPKDAARPLQLQIHDDPDAVQPILDELDGLKVNAIFAEAGKRAREYGGAAVWIICEGGGAPDEPLDLSTVSRVANLIVMDRFELSATMGNEINAISYYNDDILSPDFGTPRAYVYTPAQGGDTVTIHASRLIRFYGDDVPDRLRYGFYSGWGAPVMEGIYRTFSQVYMGLEGGADLLHEFGHMVYTLDNLMEIMSGDQRELLSEWMSIQAESRSALRATVLGKGQSAERMGTNMSGWSDVLYALLQMLSAESGMPQTKLYGLSPGGLSTDDGAGIANWSARIKSYQTDVLVPAFNRLLEIIFASRQGPTRGATPPEWMVEIEPYEIPSQEEEASVTKTYAESVERLVKAGVMTTEDARATMRDKPGLVIADEEASIDAEQEPGMAATVPDAVDLQDTALNGDQISSMLEIVTAVHSRMIPYESGVAILRRAVNVSEDEARSIIGAAPSVNALDINARVP